MGIRPNVQDPVEMAGSELQVAGTSDGDPLPVEIRVFLQQDGRGAGGAAVAGGSVNAVSSAWRAVLPSEGFERGPALAFGVEIRTRPFEATSWSQVVEIK
jgi:hypothetical protein